jgi:hypothetical protein
MELFAIRRIRTGEFLKVRPIIAGDDPVLELAETTGPILFVTSEKELAEGIVDCGWSEMRLGFDLDTPLTFMRNPEFIGDPYGDHFDMNGNPRFIDDPLEVVKLL